VAAKRLKDDELVLGIALDSASRAYPHNMLTGPNREIINDKLTDEPILVTFHAGVERQASFKDESATKHFLLSMKAAS
jgi:hypothetical protein